MRSQLARDFVVARYNTCSMTIVNQKINFLSFNYTIKQNSALEIVKRVWIKFAETWSSETNAKILVCLLLIYKAVH